MLFSFAKLSLEIWLMEHKESPGRFEKRSSQIFGRKQI